MKEVVMLSKPIEPYPIEEVIWGDDSKCLTVKPVRGWTFELEITKRFLQKLSYFLCFIHLWLWLYILF